MSTGNVRAIVDLCREVVALDDTIEVINRSRIKAGIIADGSMVAASFDDSDFVALRDKAIEHLHRRLHPPERFAR
jgi:hypothetical protein